MKIFGSQREALDFLVDRIAAEAKREGVPLSEIERKMLYFSETDWTLPDIKSVNAVFEQNCDENEYECKIAGLISRIVAVEREQGESDWSDAISKLSEGDYYLLVMYDIAIKPGSSSLNSFIPTLDRPSVRPPHDKLKLWLVAFLATFGIIGTMILWGWLYSHAGPGFRAASDWLFGDRERSRLVVALFVVVVFFGFRFKSLIRSSRR
jgi:hypothetical protein